MSIDTSSAVRKWIPDHTRASTAVRRISPSSRRSGSHRRPLTSSSGRASHSLEPSEGGGHRADDRGEAARPFGIRRGGDPRRQVASPDRPRCPDCRRCRRFRIAVTGRHHMYWSFAFQTVIAPSAMPYPPRRTSGRCRRCRGLAVAKSRSAACIGLDAGVGEEQRRLGLLRRPQGVGVRAAGLATSLYSSR